MTDAALAKRDQISDEVRRVVGSTEVFGDRGAFKNIEWLPGDASNRFYGRLHFEKSSLILMVMNAPEAFKSEEVTGASQEKPTELSFVSVGRKFEEAGIRVPHLYFTSANSEFLILEDLGDELLYNRRQKAPALRWYERALDELAAIQILKGAITPHRFTRELLTWETEHFIEYALLKRRKNVTPAALNELRELMARLVNRMVAAPPVLVHRDFHSKNLMVLEKEERIGVIDFQDALMGPPTYDLASLLRDSYVRLEDKEEEHLLKYFENVICSPVDRELFAVTSLQRNLKAVGRFYYIAIEKKRDTHIQFVKPTLLRIFRSLKQIKELKVLFLLEGLLHDEVR